MFNERLHPTCIYLVIQVTEAYKFQFKEMGNNGGYMINFGVEDSITGWAIKGIWSQD